MPIHPQIMKTGIPTMQKVLRAADIRFDVNKSQSTISTVFGDVWFISYEIHPSAIQSFTLGYICVDEIDSLPLFKAKNVFDLVSARCRQPLIDSEGKMHHNKIDFVSTPMTGYAFMEWFFVQKADPDNKLLTRAHTRDNIHNSPEYVERLERSYDYDQRLALLGGEFRNFSQGRVYKEFSRKYHATDRIYDDEKDIYVGMDFNYLNTSCTISVIEDGCIYVVDEITGALDTTDIAEQLRSRYPRARIFVYPDHAGKANSTNSTLSDIEILESAGFICEVIVNPPIRTRVNRVNQLFRDGELFINIGKALHLTRGLETQGYRNGKPDKAHEDDDVLDSLGYLAHKMELDVEQFEDDGVHIPGMR